MRLRVALVLVAMLGLLVLWRTASPGEALPTRGSSPASPHAPEAERETRALDAAAEEAAAVRAPGSRQVADPDRRSVAPNVQGSEGPTVLGTVVDSKGAPISAAEVHLFAGPLHGAGRDAATTSVQRLNTGPDGRFRFSVPKAPRRFGVAVRAAGFALKSRNQKPGIDAPFDLIPAAVLRGRILGGDERAVAVYATLDVWQAGHIETQRVLVSGPGRTYEVANLPIGRSLVLEVEPADCLSFTEEVEIESAGVQLHDIDLGRPLAITGRIVDELRGTPIAGATVGAFGFLGGNRTTDTAGRFEVLVAGTLARRLEEGSGSGRRATGQLEIRAPGYLTATVPLLPRSIQEPVSFSLWPGARLEGRVIGAPGAWDGALLSVTEPLVFHDYDRGLVAIPANARTAQVEDDGSFVFEQMLWGISEVTLELSRADGQSLECVVPAPRGPRDVVRVEVRVPMMGIRGRVLPEGWYPHLPRLGMKDRLDAPPPVRVPLAIVSIRPARSGTEAAPARTCETDALGRFQFDGLAPGKYLLQAESPSWGTETRVFTVVVPSEESSLRLLSLPVPAEQVRGRVVQPDGSPHAERELRIMPGDSDNPLRWFHVMKTDSQGEFSRSLKRAPQQRLALDVLWLGGRLTRDWGPGDFEWHLPVMHEVELVWGREGVKRPTRYNLLCADPVRRERWLWEHDGTALDKLPAGVYELEVQPRGADSVRFLVDIPKDLQGGRLVLGQAR